MDVAITMEKYENGYSCTVQIPDQEPYRFGVKPDQKDIEDYVYGIAVTYVGTLMQTFRMSSDGVFPLSCEITQTGA